MAETGGVAARMRGKIEAALAPAEIEIIDESEQHRGHAGWREGGESHFAMRVVASAFDGLNRLQRQRAVHAALREELAGPVHALSLTLQTPDEAR